MNVNTKLKIYQTYVVLSKHNKCPGIGETYSNISEKLKWSNF